MVKRGTKVIVFLGLLILLMVPLVSAGIFSDWWGKITGKLTEGTTTVNITIGNNPPTIDRVEPIPNIAPNEGGFNSTTFNFTATDTDGASNINLSSAQGRFQLTGETTRVNLSCSDWASAGNDVNFTCTIDMYYFDKNDASWTINVTVRDNSQATAENSSTSFTYNLLTAMVMAPTALGWPEVGLTATDTGANDNITINNTGNDVDLNINVTSLDLQGNTTLTHYIFAENFTVENTYPGCTGTAMVNATSTNVTSSILQRGNNTLNYNNATSGQEEISFCLKGVPQDISSQEYSSIALGAWTITIN